jgi:hypothetical protein
MALLNNDERKEMLEADDMWNLNSGFWIADIIYWQLWNCSYLDLFAGSVA